MFDCIIPFGQTCNISFLLQNCKLKKETGLFEWFITDSLKNITGVIKKLSAKESIRNFHTGSHLCIEYDDIYTVHYKLDEWDAIFKRRSERLLNTIKHNNNILFIRFEINNKNQYTYEDIEDFKNTIQTINPNTHNMKLLIISSDQTDFGHPFLIKKYCERNLIYDDAMCIGEPLNTFFINTLKEVGYTTEQLSDITFNDKSII
jgi:hypothetical protein